MGSEEREKGLPVRKTGARRASSPKPTSMGDTSTSHASSFSIHPEKASLTQMLEALKRHDHLCLIYESPEEWRAAVVPFIAIGLKRGEKCCYFADTHTAEQLHGYLQAEGVDVASTEASGQLVILCESEAYTKEGSFDPDLMISLLITETEKAIAEGYPALRLTGEMTWVLHGLPGSERLLEYEAKLNRDFYFKYPALGICQYDRWKFDPEIIKGVIMTHPLLVRGNHIYHNFYYVPPEEFLNRKRAELEVQHWLNNVEREQRIMDTLRESEEKFFKAFSANPLPMCLTTMSDGLFTDVNEAFLLTTGHSRQDVIGHTTAELGFWVEPDVHDKLIEMLLSKGRANNFECKFRMKSGEVRLGLDSVEIVNTGGQQLLLSIINDITERTKLEEALKESEIWYRHVFDNAPFGIGFSSIDGKVINLNKAMETITGYSAEEFNSINLANTYVNRADREVLVREIRQHGGVVDYPVRLRRKDGTPYDALLNIRLTTIGDREFVQTICLDITERKKAEEALTESEERYRSLIELSPEAIFVASEGKHVFINSAGLKLFGASSPDQIIGKPMMDFIHPDYREIVAERIRKALETGMASPTMEEKFLRLDGTEIDVEVRAATLVYKGRQAMQAVVRDISERKQAEEKLRLSEQNFRDSIENSPLGMRIVNEDGKTLYANKTFLDIYGYSSLEGLEAVPRRKRYTPESYNEHDERIKKRKRGEYVPSNYEISIVRKDGQVRELAVSRSEVRWNGDKQFQVIYQDITQRKRAEAEMRMKDNAMASSISGVLLLDLDGVVLYANQAYLDLWVYRNAEKPIGRNLTEIAADKELARRLLNIVRTKSEWKGELHATTRDGRTIDVLLSESLVRDEKGVPIAIMASTIDITERKRAEETLRESEARYRLLAENVRDVIWSTDMDFRFTYVSPSIKYLGDRTAEEVMSLSIEQLLTPSSQQLAMKTFSEELVMANTSPPDPNRSRTLEVEFLRRDGSTLWAELKMNFMRDTAGQPVGILGVMRDISERKKAEEERREFEQKAQLASRLASVGELSAGIAHEINNPLTGVIGYSELLMQEDVPTRIKNDLEIINNGAKRVADIVKGLLKFARQTTLEREPVNINEIIEVTLRLRGYELETSNIKVTTKLAPDLPLTVADAGQLQQVFLNLLINAEMEMRLAHGKGKLIVKTEQAGNTIRITFNDNGPGIAKENLEKIFDPFFSTREVGKGTGLGLSICHGIVTEHGGRIWAESRLGKGATFIVELPVVAEKRRSIRRPKTAHRIKVATKAKILVVDDEPVVRQLVTEVLTAEGHKVETTADGEDALNKIRNNGYNVILVDMKLPGISGGELYERIQAMAGPLAKRVLLITGDVMSADTEAFISRTKLPYITKPFDVKQLKAEIRRLLASSRPRPTPKSEVKNQKSKSKI